jgi:cytoskeleton protein RodZ
LLVLVLAVPAIAFELYQEDSTEIMIKPHLTAPSAQSLVAGAPAATAPNIVNSPPPSSFAARLPDSVTAADASEAEPGAYHLTFVFDREAWVEVRDGHGRRLLWQLNPAGSRQTVVGVPPLSLVIGNAPAVHLTLNQQPVDLASHTDIDVARLTLE